MRLSSSDVQDQVIQCIGSIWHICEIHTMLSSLRMQTVSFLFPRNKKYTNSSSVIFPVYKILQNDLPLHSSLIISGQLYFVSSPFNCGDNHIIVT